MPSDNLGDRMKAYENTSNHYLMKKTPVIIRLDGKAFHTFTKSLKEPFSKKFHQCLVASAKYTAKSMQGALIIYTQSDEVSILLKDWDSPRTESWFNYRQSKIESVASSLLTASFNFLISRSFDNSETLFPKLAMFDARSFNLPKEEVLNYFIWRQQDAIRNSVQSLAHYHLPRRDIYKKSNEEVKKMLLARKGINWDNLPTWAKEGSTMVKLLMQDENEYTIGVPRQDTNIIDLKYEPKKVKYDWHISADTNNFLENREFYETELKRLKPTTTRR